MTLRKKGWQIEVCDDFRVGMDDPLVQLRLLSHFGRTSLGDDFVCCIGSVVNGEFVCVQFHTALHQMHTTTVDGDALYFIAQCLVCGDMNGLVPVIG